MHGIEIKDGINDCWWNNKCMCTYDRYKIFAGENREGERWHDSTLRCTLTQLDVHLCSWYRQEGTI